MGKSDKKIFYVVIALCVAILLIVGVSFAYFVSSVGSAEDAVQVKSATVTISYTEGTIVNATNLIPSSQTVMTQAFHDTGSYGVCKDKNGYDVCTAYEFTVTAGTEPQEIVGTLSVTKNEFTGLKYMVLDEDDQEVTPVTALGDQSGNITFIANDTVDASASKTYHLIIWLDETNQPQEEQGKEFVAGVVVNSATNPTGQVTGEY